MKNNIYQELTDKFVSLVNEGTNPWRKCWSSVGGLATNATTLKPYNGVNQLFLGLFGDYSTPYFLTYKQALASGGNVRKGEKGSKVVFFKPLAIDNENGDAKIIPFLRQYTVFNVSQCDGLEKLDLPVPQTYDNPPLIEAERAVAEIPDCPRISQGRGGHRACYTPALDRVSVPSIEQFYSSEAYYKTLFHELAHATGHQKRLNRPGITGLSELSTADLDGYAKEELVAEIAASFVVSRLNLWNADLEEESLAYLRHWLKQLQKNPRELIHASGPAGKAADWIFGQVPAQEETLKKVA